MQRYKVVVVCCTADETDVHTIRVNGWGESEAEYNASRKIQKFHRHEYENLSRTAAEKIFNYAYDDKHAYGFHEVRWELERLIELVSKILDERKPPRRNK